MIDISCEELLNTNGFIISGFKGTSMTPLLRADRDKVYIEKVADRLKKGDIALYKRKSGEYVLHRVFKVNEISYDFWGDNQFVIERGVLDLQILGVAKGYYKGEKYIDFKKSFKYKLYKLFWCSSIFLRKFFNLFRRLKGKIKKIFSK